MQASFQGQKTPTPESSHVLPGLQKEAMDKWNGWFGGDINDKKEDEETS
jgi:hypothetical protein